MRVIGLTGGIGSGKSTVLDILRNEYAAHTLLADDIGRQAFIVGTETYSRMIDEFGIDILKPDGDIDKGKLASILMSDDEKLAIQNSIVHPFVINKIKSELNKFRDEESHIIRADDISENCKADNQHLLVAIESAILFEAGCDALCDEVWVVTAPDNIRIMRLMETRGYSKDRALSFISHQMSEQEYISRADQVIINDGSIDNLRFCLNQVLLSND